MPSPPVRRFARVFQGLVAASVAGSLAWGRLADAGIERSTLAALGSLSLLLAGFCLVVLGWLLTSGRRRMPTPAPRGEWVVATLWFLLLPVGAALLGSVAWAAAATPPTISWMTPGPAWVSVALRTAAACGAGLVLGWPLVRRLARRGEARARWVGADAPDAGAGD